eukprot:TRINITY_DN41781_c0_g1_i1.p1 TRINITY_DN41781_c0_g1~~TRINITY_DN41781_c0_g1_i1.p1  ORF type:complete len:736 (+),score=164.88 TRINITY_DN41781_c0_g1_i1:93-2300(+)
MVGATLSVPAWHCQLRACAAVPGVTTYARPIPRSRNCCGGRAALAATVAASRRAWHRRTGLVRPACHLKAACSQAAEAYSEGEEYGTDIQCQQFVRFGVTDPSLLPWVESTLCSRAPEVTFHGVLLSQEAAGCGPEQLTVFARYLEEEQVDFVAAPAKDVALEVPERLAAAAVLREDVRDAMVVLPSSTSAQSLADLPPGSRVAASCPRRQLQIAARCPLLQVEHSNLPLQARLRRLTSFEYDVVVAAAAGLQRSGLSTSAREVWPLDVAEIMPAFGQGAVAFLCLADDADVLSLLSEFDDEQARLCVACERMLVRRLGRLPPGAAVGGLAELLPDGQLSLRCTLALPGRDSSPPRLLSAVRQGDPEEAEALAQCLAEELLPQEPALADLLASDLTLPSPSSSSRSAILAEGDVEEEVDAEASSSSSSSSQVLPPLGDNPRLAASEVDGSGCTPYTGRVCAILAEGGGFLVDINCEIPALWHPELSQPSPSSSSTEPAKPAEEAAPSLGSEVEVFCCEKQPWYLRVISQKPPRLAVRAGLRSLERLQLPELRPGLGPWRAVVISASKAGTLVDFNCEIPGQLLSDQTHMRGDELRVYCHKVDAELRTCVVGVQKPKSSQPVRRTLDDLTSSPGEEAVRGTVRKVTGSGVFVDFNCEVQGYLSPMDIDVNSWPSGLRTGHEVTVYIISVDLQKRQVRVSMFQPPSGSSVRVIASRDGGGAASRARPRGSRSLRSKS